MRAPAVADTNHDTYVSAATRWEIAIKRGIGRLRLPAEFADAVEAEAFLELPVGGAHADAVADRPRA